MLFIVIAASRSVNKVLVQALL